MTWLILQEDARRIPLKDGIVQTVVNNLVFVHGVTVPPEVG